MSLTKTCNCGRQFSSWNPLRSTCDECLAANELVVLGEAESEIEAGIWKDVLDQAGIPSMTQQQASAASSYFRHHEPAGQQVFVFRRDLVRAEEAVFGADEDDDPGLASWNRLGDR